MKLASGMFGMPVREPRPSEFISMLLPALKFEFLLSRFLRANSLLR